MQLLFLEVFGGVGVFVGHVVRVGVEVVAQGGAHLLSVCGAQVTVLSGALRDHVNLGPRPHAGRSQRTCHTLYQDKS